MFSVPFLLVYWILPFFSVVHCCVDMLMSRPLKRAIFFVTVVYMYITGYFACGNLPQGAKTLASFRVGWPILICSQHPMARPNDTTIFSRVYPLYYNNISLL